MSQDPHAFKMQQPQLKEKKKVEFSTYVDEKIVQIDSKKTLSQSKIWSLIHEKMRIK